MAEITWTAGPNFHGRSDWQMLSFFFGDQTEALADFDLHIDGKFPLMPELIQNTWQAKLFRVKLFLYLLCFTSVRALKGARVWVLCTPLPLPLSTALAKINGKAHC